MRINFYGAPLDLLKKEELLNNLRGQKNPRSKVLFFLNAHCYNVFCRNKSYRDALNSADYVLNDGIGIKIGANFLKREIRENLNGTDLIPQIVQNQPDSCVFLLGSTESNVRAAARNLSNKYTAKVVGQHHGYFKDSQTICQTITESQAKILIVGMGVPLQETWIHENIEKLQNIELVVAGGAIIDFLSENVKRAPRFIRKLRLEWLYRFFQEPLRLWKRYFLGNFLFFVNLYINRKRSGESGGSQ